jgi:hypothetical protein
MRLPLEIPVVGFYGFFGEGINGIIEKMVVVSSVQAVELD